MTEDTQAARTLAAMALARFILDDALGPEAHVPPPPALDVTGMLIDVGSAMFSVLSKARFDDDAEGRAVGQVLARWEAVVLTARTGRPAPGTGP